MLSNDWLELARRVGRREVDVQSPLGDGNCERRRDRRLPYTALADDNDESAWPSGDLFDQCAE